MAKVGGRQLTLGACGLTKFAETADGRQVPGKGSYPFWGTTPPPEVG